MYPVNDIHKVEILKNSGAVRRATVRSEINIPPP
jgi:hypothetical protein